MRLKISRLTMLLGLAVCLGLASEAQADVDFSGKRIEIIISSGEGGGADTYARFVAAALEKELPGKPTILARNMAGGGGLISANWFQANAKPDGLIIYSSAPSTKLSPLFGDPGNVQFDPNSWIPVVTSPNGYIVMGSKIANTTSIKELVKTPERPLSIGLASVLGSSTVVLLSFDMLGLNVKPAFNVPGGEAQLSFERGEFQLNSDSMGSYYRLNGEHAAKGDVFPFFTYGYRQPDGTIVRDPSAPDVPTFLEVYREVHGKDPTGPAWEAWLALFEVVSMNSKTIVLPAGTPDDIVQVYRDAAKRALTNPELVKTEAYKNILGETPQQFGEDAVIAMQEASKRLTPEVAQWIKDWMKAKFDVAL